MAPFELAMLADPWPECVDVSPRKVGGVAEVEPTDHRQRPLLRPRRKRPSHCTKSCNEIAPTHSDLPRWISGTYFARDRIGNGLSTWRGFFTALQGSAHGPSR